jgi:hypothetical protein
MSDRCKMNLRANLFTEFLEGFNIELCSVVYSNSLRHSEATNNVLPEEFLKVTEVIVAKVLVSIHLEKYSTATTTYFRFPCAGGVGLADRGPTFATAKWAVLTK